MAKFNFTDSDGADVGEKYVTKEYAIDVYPNIFTNISMAGLYTWGNGGSGQLGDNTNNARSSPGTASAGGLNWRSVIGNATLAAAGIKNDGTLWTWGLAAYGALGNGSSTANRSSPGTTQGGGTDWAALANGSGGQDFLAAIKNTGTLWTWGRGNLGKLGSNTTTNRSSPVTVVGGITDWTMASCGYLHMAAIRSTGQLYTWGSNITGQLGAGATGASRSSPATTSGGGTNWIYCSAGGDQVSGVTAAIKSDGTLWTWGSGGLGVLGNGDSALANRSSPGTTAGGGNNWKSVAASGIAMAAIKTDGTLWTWGSNGFGTLGDGTVDGKSSPVTVAGAGANWVRASTNGSSTAAIKSDGTLWTWGFNSSGELGSGSTNNRSSPGTIAGGGNGWKLVSIANMGAAINEEDGW